MLYPQNNRYRTCIDLSGFWEIKVDADDNGLNLGWQSGFEADAFIGVPGSWNEQLAELGLINYAGPVWHQTRFWWPAALAGQHLFLRFGSADFHATVWINGELVGEHQGGYLPFEFDITQLTRQDRENVLVVRVDNRLTHETIPQGVTDDDFRAFNKLREATYPPTTFDFLAFGGIHRPVKLAVMPARHLHSVQIETSIEGTTGVIEYHADFANISGTAGLQVSIVDGDRSVVDEQKPLQQSHAAGRLVVEGCRFWSPEDPHLYTLRFSLSEGETVVDEYELEVGVREVEVDGAKLLLNGRPVFLKGFGKHEDFAVLGKGLSHPLIVKDFQLMKWLGANSFRTSHYPYAEETLQMADRLGFFVIDECPAVSLNFKHVNDQTLHNHKTSLTELIARDRNHACVIAWSIGNEPGIWLEEEATLQKAEDYWSAICEHVRSLEPSRPITLPTCANLRDREITHKFVDFISINRYWGWYETPTDIEKAGEQLETELQALFKEHQKPILVAEFGADTVEGLHATYPQLYTEEYQTMLIEKYFEVIESLPFAMGEHIWNFADFRTAQHHRRVVLNKKGVFNRQREPKAAAFAVRKHWLARTDRTEHNQVIHKRSPKKR